MSEASGNILKVWRWKLHWQILLGLIIGALLGIALGASAISDARELQPDDKAPAAAFKEKLDAAGVSDEQLTELEEAAKHSDATPADIVALVHARSVRDQMDKLAPRNTPTLAVELVEKSTLYMLLDLIGDLFLQGLKLIIVPLVVTSILLAIVNIGEQTGFARLGGKTLLYYASTSLIAILIGLTLVDIVQPGIGTDGRGILEGRDLSAFADAQQEVQAKVGDKQAKDFLDVFREMVPPNVVKAAAEGQLLGLIIVALLVGYFLARLRTEAKAILVNVTQGIYDITLSITDIVLRLAPIGVVGLLGATFAEQYAKLVPDARFGEFLSGVVTFAVVALAALMLHIFGVMPLVLTLIARVNPLRHYRAMAPALMTAFSTASSSATLPVTMDCVEERAGVSNKTASFVLPLGATVNMDGTALYECVAAIFICQAFGVELSFAQQFMIVITALLTSIGVAGVPAASLVAIVIILNAVQSQLPPEAPALIGGIGLLMVFDRPLDMCRTAVNIFGDSCGAVVIAKSEGEQNVLVDGEPADAVDQPTQ